MGSWDGFTKLIPLGHDEPAGVHSLRLILRKGIYRFRFVVVTDTDTTECVSHANVWPVEEDETGLASHVMGVE